MIDCTGGINNSMNYKNDSLLGFQNRTSSESNEDCKPLVHLYVLE